MGKKRAGYLAYMLRLWQTKPDAGTHHVEAKATWRASIENPHTGERRGFLSLEALFAFLAQEVAVLGSHCTHCEKGNDQQGK